jgi:transposase
MVYSHDLRMKALSYIENGGSKEEACQIFGITLRTLFNWIKRKKQGCLAPNQKRQRKSYKIDEEKLKAYIKEHPDAYLREIAHAFEASISAIFYACKRLKINLKKRHHSIAREMRKKEKSFNKS